ncbi:MAG: type II toxin-antitoxin system RelE/ParE family toxin [Nitrococcus mobilis]|nr:type II toxin-antitoxin system RelE/ParE family toxin [Nitrococcus mobilis]
METVHKLLFQLHVLDLCIRRCAIRPGIRRHEHESHVIFYREDDGGILVLAVIHRRMRPDLFPETGL